MYWCVCVRLRVYMYAYMIAHGSWHKDTLPAHHTSHGWKQSNSKSCKVCRMMQDGTQCTITVIRVLCPFAVPKVKRGIVAGSGFSAWTLLSGYEREASQEPRSAGDAARTPHLRTARQGGFRCVLDCAWMSLDWLKGCGRCKNQIKVLTSKTGTDVCHSQIEWTDSLECWNHGILAEPHSKAIITGCWNSGGSSTSSLRCCDMEVVLAAEVVQVQMDPFLTQQQQEVPSKAKSEWKYVKLNGRRMTDSCNFQAWIWMGTGDYYKRIIACWGSCMFTHCGF